MRKQMGWIGIGVLVALFFYLGPAAAAPPDNFTAKMVIGGMTMPMAKMGNKTRSETGMLQGIYTIHDGGAKKTIMISPNSKSYFEQGVETKKAPSVYDHDVVMDKKKIGSETIDGHPSTKSEMTFYHKDTPNQKHHGTVWEAQDLGGLPIRTEMVVPEMKKAGGGGKMVMELKDVKVGAATASMFEVPKDYKKVNSMQELMGMGDIQNMMKQMQKGKLPPKQ
ncbi:MAG: hypothetical protein HY892_19485 [Deltaproteobacteria bacterium]|nr:hypothetical protein [Deltaproteobacteria bacterium]